MTLTVWTVGHSDRSAEELLALLAGAGIRVLVDVRAWPRSRRHPRFDREPLQVALEGRGITYHWAGRQLGGRRPERPGSPHRALPEGLRGYADHMEGEAFRRGAAQLLSLAAGAPTAVLCAERDPDRCHRGLLADWLTVRGAEVVHLLGPGERRVHRLHPALRVEGRRLVYDRGVPQELPLT